jgi:hypothetical protein
MEDTYLFYRLLDSNKNIYPVCLLENKFFLDELVNYFLMFGSIVKNKLENTFQFLVMSGK